MKARRGPGALSPDRCPVPCPVRSSDDNIPPSVLDSSANPATQKRNPRISKKDRSMSGESRVYHTALTFKASWKEYCNSTAIHGVRYFVEEGRTRFERCVPNEDPKRNTVKIIELLSNRLKLFLAIKRFVNLIVNRFVDAFKEEGSQIDSQ